MDNLKGKKITFIILNLYNFLSCAVCLFINIILVNDASRSVPFMCYFTTLSNLYSMIISLILAIYAAYHFDDDNFKMHRVLKIFHLTSATSLALTFTTTVFFLTPMLIILGSPLSRLYGDYLILFHVINPLVHIATYIFFYQSNIKRRDTLYALIPMVSYTIFYPIMVTTHNMIDVYNFTFGGKFYLIAIVIPVMIGITYLLSFVLYIINKKVNKKYE